MYIPESWERPILVSPVTKHPLSLSPGLYVMYGPRAVGKTLTSLALAAWLLAAGVRAVYRYVLEPRSLHAQDLLSPTSWQNYLSEGFEVATGGVLIIDSMTYVLSMLPGIADSRDLADTTYPGGLKPRDVMGALAHDALARRANVALIATLNSDLFPVVKDLEGATEGQIQVMSPGVVKHRDRTLRTESIITIPKDPFVDDAAELLGYSGVAITSQEDRI